MDGEELVVMLWTYTGFPEREKAVEIMQADFNEIGLKTEIQAVDFGALQPMLESGETGLDYMRWTLVDQSILWRCSSRLAGRNRLAIRSWMPFLTWPTRRSIRRLAGGLARGDGLHPRQRHHRPDRQRLDQRRRP